MLVRKFTVGQILNNLKYRYSSRKPVLNYDPVVLSVHATSNCTLSCDMCQTHSRKIPQEYYHHEGSRDIDFETFKQFVDRFKNATTVSLIGTGEPLLNKDFFKMARYAVFEKKMIVHTVSNGTIIGSKIDDILDCGLKSIEISVNGHNSGEFHRMTGQSERSFHVICNNINELVIKRDERESGLKISLSFILDRINYKDIIGMIGFAEKFNIDEATLHNFLPSPVPGFTAEERCLYADDEDVVDTISRLRQEDHKMKITLPVLIDKNRNRKYCSTYFRLLRIDGEGNVGGCAGQLLNLSGNGKFYDDDVWNNSHFQERRKMFLDADIPELTPCRDCCHNNRPVEL
jgi:MoaA/NifB/PqqE/SkfB family radical SAM enzyme